MIFLGNRMKDRVRAREELTIPTYTLTRQKRKIPKQVFFTVLAALLIFSSFYLLPMLLEEPDLTYRASVDLRGMAEPGAMESAQSYLRNNPEMDFDNDGLTNEQELDAGTGVYIQDNDDDGVTDYAELFLTETNPRVKDDAIIKFVINADNKNGNTVNTPFKIGNIVLWADDYESKARGSVVQLPDGSYNFYRFKGWVQFPGEAAAAYMVENNYQTALKRNDSGYFYIEGPGLINVRIYQKQPEACYIVSLLGNRYSMPDNIFFNVLSFILPSKGFGLITCRRALSNDIDGTWDEVAVTNEKSKYRSDSYPIERFEYDQQTLEDLSGIFTEIDSGNNVIVSLMSHEVGEVILEVYGYTSRNNLLVCDPSTGENFGVINISVIGERHLDQSGTITQYEHFRFDGCGYSSLARHRIVVLDYVDAGATVNWTDKFETPSDDIPDKNENVQLPETNAPGQGAQAPATDQGEPPGPLPDDVEGKRPAAKKTALRGSKPPQRHPDKAAPLELSGAVLLTLSCLSFTHSVIAML